MVKEEIITSRKTKSRNTNWKGWSSETTSKSNQILRSRTHNSKRRTLNNWYINEGGPIAQEIEIQLVEKSQHSNAISIDTSRVDIKTSEGERCIKNEIPTQSKAREGDNSRTNTNEVGAIEIDDFFLLLWSLENSLLIEVESMNHFILYI